MFESMTLTVHFTNPFSSIVVSVVDVDGGRNCTLVGAVLVLVAITLPCGV